MVAEFPLDLTVHDPLLNKSIVELYTGIKFYRNKEEWVMGAIISFGNQKGGVGKTTTTAITGYLLSKKYKVLCVDFDSQGNLTQFLTQRDIHDYSKMTILEACKNGNPTPYIRKLTYNLHLIPADEMLATLPMLIHQNPSIGSTVLRDTLHKVKARYDYILIDLPPNLGEHTINGLVASDYAIVMLQCEPMCYDALDRYIATMIHIKEVKKLDLVLCGILPTMIDSRTVIDKTIIDRVRREYEGVVFRTEIKRKNRIKEFSITGIQEYSNTDTSALSNYKNFVEELEQRVQA
jgi:chromosome partitioning protein